MVQHLQVMVQYVQVMKQHLQVMMQHLQAMMQHLQVVIQHLQMIKDVLFLFLPAAPAKKAETVAEKHEIVDSPERPMGRWFR